VLGKLLKSKKRNNGQAFIHTAHDHEKIINNPDPDFTLVELEAERVANEAVKALKESRKHCRPAESGIPNLVGIKFGSKLKVSTNETAASAKTLESSAFTTTTLATTSSSSLLDRIKLRTQAIHVDSKKTTPSSAQKKKTNKAKIINSTNPIDRSIEMSKLIKEYFTTVTPTMNRASTEDVVEYFKEKLLKEDGAKFKAILKKLCSFNEKTRVWSLHDNYFNI